MDKVNNYMLNKNSPTKVEIEKMNKTPDGSETKYLPMTESIIVEKFKTG